jgi:sec-independent protein translocase protein TatC
VKKTAVMEEETERPLKRKKKKKVLQPKSEIAKVEPPAPLAVVEDETVDAGPEQDKPMTFWEHLEELRSRLIRSAAALLVGTGIVWYFKNQFLDALTKPFCDAWVKEQIEGQCRLTFGSPQSSFTSYAKLSVIGGLGIAAPFVFYQLWGFIAPGLYQREKRYVVPFVLFSTLLFVGGAWFGYLGAFPFTFDYFLSLSKGTTRVHQEFMVTTESYIDFVTQVLLGFGIIFEIPIVMTFLAMIGVVNHRILLKFARYYILIAFVAAAILSPPDATSMIVMALPACLLYFLSIGLVYIFQQKKDEGGTPKKKEKQPAAAS